MAPNPDRAAKYLAAWLEQNPQHESQVTAAAKLEKILELVDEDYADCETDRQRQAVWSVIAAASHSFMARSNGSSAAFELSQALQSRSYGLRGHNALDANSPKVQQRSIDEDFERARILVALETHPHRRDRIFRNARLIAGMGKKEIRKFQDNVKQAQIKALAFHRNVAYLKKRAASGDLTLIQDLLN